MPADLRLARPAQALLQFQAVRKTQIDAGVFACAFTFKLSQERHKQGVALPLPALDEPQVPHTLSSLSPTVPPSFRSCGALTPLPRPTPTYP